MSALRKGLVLAALQVLLVCSLGAKLLYDRATRPHVWIQVATYDPDLPIRGRYLNFSLQLPAEGFSARENPQPYTNPYSPSRCDLMLRNGKLTAVGNENGEFWVNIRLVNNVPVAIVNTNTPFFIPEHANVATPRAGSSEELWIEATLPRKGPPRPDPPGFQKRRSSHSTGFRVTPSIRFTLPAANYFSLTNSRWLVAFVSRCDRLWSDPLRDGR